MPDDRDRLGSSGVFQAIVEGARKFKRAVTGGEEPPDPEVVLLGEKIGQAFVAGRFADVHALGTPQFRERTAAEVFASRWRDVLRERVPLTGFRVADAGPIEIQFIPGLEEVSQELFVAFLQITFSSPDVPLDDQRAYVVGAVLLEHGKRVALGALHAQ
jgi:hypothetical protein